MNKTFLMPKNVPSVEGLQQTQRVVFEREKDLPLLLLMLLMLLMVLLKKMKKEEEKKEKEKKEMKRNDEGCR